MGAMNCVTAIQSYQSGADDKDACHCGISTQNLCGTIGGRAWPCRCTVELQEAPMAKRGLRTTVFAAMAIASFPATEAVAGDVNVGVHIGIPVPPPPRI